MSRDDSPNAEVAYEGECRECHMPLASGYLCDHCDDVEVLGDGE